MRFKFIEEHQGTLPINRLCQIMNVSTRGYRAYRTRPISQSQRTDLVLLTHIRDQFALSHNSYGRVRMTEELKELGLQIGHRRVGRLMRQNGISVTRTRKHKVTTNSNHRFNIAPNLLDRNFTADRPNQKWVVDISYIWTREGWMYLAAVLDLHSRRVIGLLSAALRLPAGQRGCIHHSDRGSQYCSHEYQACLRKHGFKVSMSGKGNCYDNAVMETFFKTIEAELIWRDTWYTRRQAELAIFEYINHCLAGGVCTAEKGFLQSATQTLSIRMEKPLGFRTDSRLNENSERN